MSRKSFKLLVLSVFFGGFVCLWVVTDSVAGVNIDIGTPNLNISIGTPPPVVIQSPPPMAVIPGTYVYIAPDISVDILFYRGHWYRPHGGHWFRASSYNGPWVHAVPSKVPRAILELPPRYHSLPPGLQRIPFKHVKGSWKQWEKEKHWHHDKGWREDKRGGHEEAREDHEGRGKHGRRH